MFAIGLCGLHPSGLEIVGGNCNVCFSVCLEVEGGAVVCGEAGFHIAHVFCCACDVFFWVCCALACKHSGSCDIVVT